MGFLGNAIKGGLAVKAVEVVRGQLAKRSGTTPARGSSGRLSSRMPSRRVTGRPAKARKR
jgi:hypothetical protein